MSLTADNIIHKIDNLRAERSVWEQHWQELADFMVPRKNAIQRSRVPGERTNFFLLDNTALQSNVLLAGFLHGLLTNPNSQFFELTTGIREIDDRDEVRLWLQETSIRMLHTLNNSNFQTEIHELYIDIGSFGTSCMSILEDDQSVVRFKTEPISDFFIEENSKGQIIEVYKEFKWNINQIIDEFGSEVISMSPKLEKAARERRDDKFLLVHAVYPKKRDPLKKTLNSWVSQYILKDEKIVLRASGFRSFPYVVPRWTKNTGEKYGRSAGMNALPECKTLNLMVETTIKGAQKVVDPPLMVPDDGFLGSIRTRPGSVNFFRSGTPKEDRIQPMLNDARIDFGFQAVEEQRKRIREAFFVDQLRLRDGTPQMTATEVEARIEQAFRFMGPVLGRQQSELLRPLIDRVFEIMERRDLIDPAPDILRDRVLDVQYSSMIARSQRQGEARAISRTLEQATPFISADPSILDNIDGDKALRLLARINNFPQEILRDQDEVDSVRQQRAQQEADLQSQQEAAQVAQNIGAAAPGLAAIGGGRALGG